MWDSRVCDSSPAFWPLRRAAQAFAAYDDWPSISDYTAAFEEQPPVRFELAPPKPRRGPRTTDYDARIHLERIVPTRRANWHDFFNALVWATFPQAKWQLHERQYRAARRRAVHQRSRSREEDALALLDEGGIILLCDTSHADEARDALDRRADADVARLIASRAAVAVLFGHALYENLAHRGPPVRGMVALVISSELAANCIAHADAGLAALLERPDTFTLPTGHGSLPLDPALFGEHA